MTKICGIRSEDKNKWEARTPIVPSDVKELTKEGIKFYIQPSEIRAFGIDEYKRVGAQIKEDLSQCPVIFGVKEMPPQFFQERKTYVFFAHVVKGQNYNMPMLKRMMELGCNLIDYEKVEDENGRRLIFFGRFAGLAGVINTLWAFGQRLSYMNISNPFIKIKKTYEYSSLNEIKKDIKHIGEKILRDGLSKKITPCVIGITGYGNVSKGVQEIVDFLPVKAISPKELLKLKNDSGLFKVVFREENMVEPINKDDIFELNDYYIHPEKYRTKFHQYLPHLSILINCIYWETKYPKLVTKSDLKRLFKDSKPKLKVIGDISCDIEGSIEATLRITEPDMPVFTYNPQRDYVSTGFKGNGIIIMAVDNLPCELPRDSSEDFSGILKRFVTSIVSADYSNDFNNIELPDEIKRALILFKGKLTPEYKYLEKHI
ncbi:hypothetical protein KAX35_06030 [candidate division WOR-3 bacterium]|nr:hypothetical protein [candidate division WOR-3 bacterium]